MKEQTRPAYPGLQHETSVPEENLAKYSILLYGQEKIGKTTFAAQFSRPYFFLFEPGGKALAIKRSNIQDWGHFRVLLKQMEVDTKYDNVIFDTADVAVLMCEQYILQVNGVSDLTDMEFGKGWRALRSEFASGVQRLIRSGKGVMFTSHATEKEYKTKDGRKITRIFPTMSKQAREILEPIVDIWAYYRYNGTKREILIRGDEEVAAGHRTERHFLGVSAVPAGNSPQEAYKNFLAAFENRLGSEVPKKASGFKFK